MDLLLLRECRPLLQVCPRAETRVYIASYNQSSCWACFSFVMYAVDLVAQLGKKLSRDGIAGRGTIKRKDAYATTMWRWNVMDVDGW